MNNKIFFLLPLLLSSCAKKVSQKNNAPKSLTYRKIYVDGVECKYCAQAAVMRLEKIKGVKRADFVCKNDKWEQGYVRLFSTEDISDTEISKELDKENFHIK